jgi:3-oxoacyl-[acyl-carrier protein] reductase
MLSGKVAVVTGAGNGIGAEIAKLMAKHGAKVVVNDAGVSASGEGRDTAVAGAVVEQIQSAGGQAVASVHNVADWDDAHAIINDALEAFGRIDVVVNNAGLGGSAAVVDMTDEEWHKVLDVSLTSVFRMTRAVLPHMYQRGSGAIVNNASVLGWRAQPLQAHYAAAKAGVMAFTRCSAMEAAAHGVRINAVAPSIAMQAFLNRVTSDELLSELRRREAFGRTAETWEVANTIVFLASDLASYLTGEVLSVSSQHP